MLPDIKRIEATLLFIVVRHVLDFVSWRNGFFHVEVGVISLLNLPGGQLPMLVSILLESAVPAVIMHRIPCVKTPPATMLPIRAGEVLDVTAVWHDEGGLVVFLLSSVTGLW